MPRNEHKKSIRAETAAILLISRPDIGIRNAMRRSGYTKDESEKEYVSEMNIPSIEETELARKQAESVTDARMVILGNMSSSETQDMLSTKIQHETQASVVNDLDEID
jgi:hypothetical protein